METSYTLRSCWKFSWQQWRWAELKLLLLGALLNMRQTFGLLKWHIAVMSLAIVGADFLLPKIEIVQGLLISDERNLLSIIMLTIYGVLYVLFARPSMQLKNWRYVCSYFWHVPGLLAIALLPQVMSYVLKKIAMPVFVYMPLSFLILLAGLAVSCMELFFLDDVPTCRSWMRAVENGCIALVYFLPLFFAGWIMGVLVFLPLFFSSMLLVPIINLFKYFDGVFIATIFSGVMGTAFIASLFVGIYLRIKHTYYTLFFPQQAKSTEG